MQPPLEPWVAKIGAFLLGKLAEDDFIAASVVTDHDKDQGQHCEAWYYAGMKCLLSGDKKAAADDFGQCLDTKQAGFTEYILAKAELKALGIGN